MQLSDLRVALFSGNYNYTKDGANGALNRLVGYLLAKGAAVRVYAPVVAEPAFPPTGDLIDVPAFSVPTRSEYRIPYWLSPRVKRDLHAFKPNMIHVSAPEFLGHAAVRWARRHRLPVVASVHTRFDTYPRYYNLAFLEPFVTAVLRRFYRRCNAIVAPSESMAQVLREQRMNSNVGIWSRGVDHHVFNLERRSLAWRQSLGIADDEVVVGFVGRLVMEKGLDVFAETIDELVTRGVGHRVLVIGKGPAEDWFAQNVPDAVFAGFQAGDDLGRAVASIDVLLNPSVTETFGNVTLEAMACAVPVVAADATGADSLVDDTVSGRLVRPGAVGAFADALQHYIEDRAVARAAGVAGLRIAQRYSWDAINGVLARTYLRVIASRR